MRSSALDGATEDERTAVSGGSQTILSPEQATTLAMDVLARLGFDEDDSSRIAKHLVEAELSGSPMMGLIRLKLIADLVEKARPGTIRVERDGPTHALVDGAGNPGYLSADVAMEIAIGKARETGIAMVGIKNSSLAGMAGHYALQAAEAGLIGLVYVSSYGRVAPHGGTQPVLGTNPMAFGFPATPYPVLVDASTSTISNGQVEISRLLGVELPPDCALDADGRPTRDPVAAQQGALLPAAQHKGFGFAIAMQLLGMLVGGDAVPQGLGNQGIMVMAVDPTVFTPLEDYMAHIQELIGAVKQSAPAPGVEEILIPGEGRMRRRERILREGIPVGPELRTMLETLG